ncbi:MAG: ribonuclease HI [Gammaproteobacteria bacterium]|jgi:ribonuclease HI|nr:ribonuclease HI [Gammaproteobacteria bacterium]
MSKVITIYTDGACRGNPGPGGWGALLEYGDKQRTLHGGEDPSTNNRMELTAVIKALEVLKSKCQIELYTDSKYVLKGITEWLPNWKKRNWLTASKKPVQNVDLWKELDALVPEHEINWHWVKGHSGDRGNEMADQLANKGIDER